MELSGGQLVVFPFLLLVLPIVAVLAWWLKRRYAAAVAHLQNESLFTSITQHDDATGPEGLASVTSPSAPELSLRITRADEQGSDLDDVCTGAAHLRLRRRVLLVQFISGLLYWFALTLFTAAVMAGTTHPLRLLIFAGPPILLLVFVPAVIAWALQVGLRHTFVNVPAGLIVLAGLGFMLSKGGWESGLGVAFGYASVALVVSAFMRPSLRGAGLPLMTAAISGWLMFAGLYAIALAFEDSTDDVPLSALEIGRGVIELILMLGAGVWCGRRTLIELSARYSSKRFSDMQLALGMYWALLTAFLCGSVLKDQTYLAIKGLNAAWVCMGILLLWVLWRSLQSMALRAVISTAAPPVGTLLFLRVFKASNRSERFTDRFFAYWRFAGPVWMIAGPDLAGAYMEPPQFFAYIGRRLHEQFVGDPRDAAARVQALDNARDPDGRFRIHELLCSRNSWQPTVLQMIARAGVILLDLREYSHQHKGMRFELTELLRGASLAKVVLLIDANEDVLPLTNEVASIWRDIGHSRILTGELGFLQILRFGIGTDSEMYGLFRASVHAATNANPRVTC